MGVGGRPLACVRREGAPCMVFSAGLMVPMLLRGNPQPGRFASSAAERRKLRTRAGAWAGSNVSPKNSGYLLCCTIESPRATRGAVCFCGRPALGPKLLSAFQPSKQRQGHRLEMVVFHPHLQFAFAEPGFEALAGLCLAGAADRLPALVQQYAVAA